MSISFCFPTPDHQVKTSHHILSAWSNMVNLEGSKLFFLNLNFWQQLPRTRKEKLVQKMDESSSLTHLLEVTAGVGAVDRPADGHVAEAAALLTRLGPPWCVVLSTQRRRPRHHTWKHLPHLVGLPGQKPAQNEAFSLMLKRNVCFLLQTRHP